MIRRAFLIDDPSAPDFVVGGLPVRTRQLLSLRDAGLDVTAVAAHEIAAATDEDAIVARAACVWHPALVKRLARLTIAPDAVAAIGPSATSLMWVCGSNRTRSVVASLAHDPGAAVAAAADPPRPPEFVVAVRTPDECRAATRLLLLSLEKPTDGIASRYVHRRISRPITRLVLPWGVTPNAMTLFAALFGVGAVLLAWRGGYRNVLAGTALFWIQNILDGCDGEIARLKYLRSRTGEWLDQVIDDVLNIAFLAAIGVGLARGGFKYAVPLTWIGVIAQAIHVAGLYAGLLLRGGGRGNVAVLRWWVGHASEKRLAGDLFRRDVLSLAYLVAAVMNGVVVVFVWQLLLTVSSAVVTTLQWIVWGGPTAQTEGEGGADRAGAATA